MKVDYSGNSGIIFENTPIMKNPKNGSTPIFTLMKETECTISFRVLVNNNGLEETWYFIQFESKTKGKTIRGYVHSSSIYIDEEELRSLSILPGLAALNSEQCLMLGDRDEKAYQIYCLQCVLFSHHFFTSEYECDGLYGPRTKAAVLELQKFYNDRWGDYTDLSILEDGIFGPQTWNALFDLYGYN